MKKLFAILLTVAMLASMATIVSAAELTTTKTTTLTTTVPAATYTLNIPEDQKIDFGANETNIGSVTITNATGFAVGKNVKLTVESTPFSSEATNTTIPFVIKLTGTCPNNSKIGEEIMTGSSKLVFKGRSNGSVQEHIIITHSEKEWYTMENTVIEIASEDWGKALAGDYTATITFTTEVVVEE